MSDDDLRKWDSEVRGNIHSPGSPSSYDSKLYSAPSVTRIKASQRGLGGGGGGVDNSFSNTTTGSSQQIIHTNDLMLTVDQDDDNDILGGSNHDDGQGDDDDGQQRYAVGGRGAPPDQTFAATQLIHLTRGNTAYKIIESEGLVDDRGNTMDPITIVCLHGLTDSSYIWEDIAEVLSSSDAGPCARVVVFDFYGRGRSPWSGFPCTLDVYVTQLKELLDKLVLSTSPVHLLGYCLGGAVATGFAVKFPHLCKSLCLIDAAGVRLKNPARYKILKRKCLGEIVMLHRRSKMAESQLELFYDTSYNSEHRPLVDKQMNMVNWQLANTPGYTGAILSTYRYFPLSSMADLFAVAGRRQREVLIIWGDDDELFPWRKAKPVMEYSFPNSEIQVIEQCGHNPIFEKFEEVATCLAEFYKGLSYM